MTGLPSFKKPPVNEVALAVQFEPEPRLTSLDLVPLRSVFSDGDPRYPDAQEMQPLGRIEPHGAPVLQFTTGIETPRYWFVSNDKVHLVQVQRDRLAVNWRRQSTDPYPRYSSIKPRLVDAWNRFTGHLAGSGHPTPKPDVAEVTYVNAIEAAGSGVWDRHDEIAKVFAHWSAPSPAVDGLDLTTAGFNLQYRMPDVDGTLSVTVDPVTNTSTGALAFLLTLVARAEVKDRDFDGALEVLDRGREAIVTTFAAMTTPEMHTVWERFE